MGAPDAGDAAVTDRQRLLIAQLRFLARSDDAVRDVLGQPGESLDVDPFPLGAQAHHQGGGIVLVDVGTPADVAKVAAWAAKLELDRVMLIAREGDLAPAANYAAALSGRISVWRAVDTHTEQILAAQVDAPVVSAVPDELVVAFDTDVAELADMVCENGIWRVEVRGLEVGRANPTLEVGVGAADRDIHTMMTPPPSLEPSPDGRTDLTATLLKVAELVSSVRNAAHDRHPLAMLCRERWVRSDLFRHAADHGWAEATPVDPPRVRENLRADAVAPLRVTTGGGQQSTVVCGRGTDLCLAADAAVAAAGGPLSIVAWDVLVPAAITRTLAWLGAEAEVVACRPPWSQSI